MWRLKVCLWIVAAACVLAGVAIFLPLSTYNYLAQLVASTQLPDDPAFVYAMRALSATYLAVGVFFGLLALYPRRYAILVPFSGVSAVFVGLVCAVVGIIEGLPAGWVVGDAAFGIVFGSLILHFWRASIRPEDGEKTGRGPAEQKAPNTGSGEDA